jgi:cytochrome c biogenesis protein CcmG/thiol:disulfide interchange protein DsbE
MRTPRPRRAFATMAVLAAAAFAVAACGEGDSNGAGPSASASPPETSTEQPHGELGRNVRLGDRIVGEGRAAFERRLETLRRHPVVVNQWASWCESCRFEFPFFADAAKRYRAQVAFVGLDSQDDRASAEQFIEELPVGFPSIFDPDAEVAAAYGGGQAWPTTIFFDASGEVVNVKIGAYATAELLDEDIERYALGTGADDG